MIDPNNVLIRCPNGHELQAAKADLDKPLACPVCNVTFTPAVGPVSQAESSADVDGTGGAVSTVDYAGEAITSPINYPGYTNWMLGLWVAVTILGAIMGLYQLASTSEVDQSTSAASKSVLGFFYSCSAGVAGIVAVALTLMWVYRIHKDARRGRNYRSVSPGLALGLSFIPVFNYVWVTWTMKKLAAFARPSDAAEDSTENPAIKATSLCLVAGIVLALSNCVTYSLMGRAWIGVMSEVAQQKISQQEMQTVMTQRIASSVPFVWQIISPLISVVCVLFFFRAVRSLEAALYPFLGAPNR